MAHSRRTARTSPPHRWPGDSGGMPTNAEHPHGDTTADTPGHSSSPWDLTTEPTQPTSVESPWVTPPAAGGTASPAPPVVGPPSGTHRLPPWRRRAVGTATLVAVALGGGATGAAVTARYVGGRTTTVTTSATPADLTGTSSAPTEPLAQVAAAVQPSVVSVTVTTSSGGDEGSGVILRSDGTILTNNHVVEAAASAGAGGITVKFANGKTADASIVGRDPATDLAIIRAKDVSGLTPATLGSTSTVHVGDTVLAIGSPLGLEGSVSAGIVSALHRTVNLGSSQSPSPGRLPQRSQASAAAVGDAVQTDAAINPGNSGGPLVDDQGRVIGINTAIASLGSSSASGQSGNIGVGFAIPVDEARTVADQLMTGQTPAHAVLGVSITDNTGGGALVGTVAPGSAAAAAGLREGDVITALDDSAFGGADDLTAAVRTHKPGDRVTIHFTRDGAAQTTAVTMGSTTGG
jgi:putative serine protease PepD